jgi:hypothetical protein
MRELPPLPVRAAAGFFAVSGALEVALALWETRPLSFWPVWDAGLRGVAHLLLAYGLWLQRALCRSIAIVYCIAALVTYGIVLGLAFAQAPVLFPDSLKLQSMIQVPSCVLLLPFLRSRRASELFPHPLFGR